MSTLKANAIVDSSGGTTTTVNNIPVTVSNMMGRNRIINGDMRIDQRNNGALISPAVNGDYYLDRWRAISSSPGRFSIGRNAGVVALPAGFTNYLGLTSLTAYTPASAEIFSVRQSIEGFNVADLAWGTSAAQPATISFWVRSSLTGTFGAMLRNSAQNRAYPITYTISAANTWEYKTLTVVGDTTGTWLTDNGIGVELQFSIGAGSAVAGGTVGAWNAGNFQAPAGCVNLVGTNAATFYITGVQLEAGSVATPFERRPYGQELALCQRYYEVSGGTQTLAIAASTRLPAYFAVVKRSAPTLVYNFAAGTNTVSLDVPTTSGFRVNNSAGGSVGAPCDFTWTASAEL